MSSADPEVPFAFWLDPINAVKVSYSLPVFHEIDFQVNEGYRRIPHGGVEVGGLLYGKVFADSISLDAFRPIECEHASGPSFHLSERDLVNLSNSIQAAPKDEELQGLIPLGWFISHTRSALRMTERELELFRRFFPEPKRVTLLVKPERYKPTRFAFLLRNSAGKVNPDGEQQAIILPLPGRPGKSAPALSPAIAAPKPVAITRSAEPVSPPPALEKQAPLKANAPKEEAAVPPIPLAGQEPEAEISEPSAAQLPEDLPESNLAVPEPAQPGWSGRLLLILIIAALLGCAGGYWAYLQLPPSIIALSVKRRANDLFVFWDPAQTQSSRYAVIRVDDSPPVLLTEEQKVAGIAEVPLAGSSTKVEIISEHWARESRGIIRFVPAHPLPPRVIQPRTSQRE